MNSKIQQLEIMLNMCLSEINELQSNAERLFKACEKVKPLLEDLCKEKEDGIQLAGRSGEHNMDGLITFNRYATQLSTVTDITRKLNFYMQTNAMDETLLSPSNTFGSEARSVECLKNFFDGVSYLEVSNNVTAERLGIEQPSNVTVLDIVPKPMQTNSKKYVHYKFNEVGLFLRSILNVKNLSAFKKGFIFYGRISCYQNVSTSLVLNVWEFADYSQLFYLQKTADFCPTDQFSLSDKVFGFSEDSSDAFDGKRCVWRAVKPTQELDVTNNTVILIDFEEIVEITEESKFYVLPPFFREYAPVDIKCVLEAVCDSNGTVITHDPEKCIEVLRKHVQVIKKFRVVHKVSRVVHVQLIIEGKEYGYNIVSENKVEGTTNPISFVPMERLEVEENNDQINLSTSIFNGNKTPAVMTTSGILVNIGDLLHVCVTHVGSPLHFYGYINNGNNIEEIFFCKENEISEKQKSIPPPILNDIVLAQYHEDKRWYRAEIIEIISEKTQKYKVFFIDFGNLETVKINELAACNAEFLKKNPQAVPFRIADLQLTYDVECNFDVSKDKKLGDGTLFLRGFIENKTIKMEVVDLNGEELIVRLIGKKYSKILKMLKKMDVVENC